MAPDSKSLVSAFHQTLGQEGRYCDPQQLAVVVELERLLSDLNKGPRRTGWFGLGKPLPVQGLYLWGDVGRGKTWLMDFFYDAYPSSRKSRLHFHLFMQGIHQRLALVKGRSDPLRRIARDIAHESMLLCLDEFSVNDIGDAVIMAGVLRALFSEGVTLVTTSNLPPEKIYENGLQRVTFLPAIELIRLHTRVMNLGGERDFRRELLERSGVYHAPLDQPNRHHFGEAFDRMTDGHAELNGTLTILGREIPFIRQAEDVIWFDFTALCGPPRSQNDYIEIARLFHTVFISDIHRMDGSSDERANRFISLVDLFYDHKVKLVVLADATPERLYCGERLAFEFRRTISRLHEMGSTEYLHSRHLS
jgi:cell division protein ZapE